MKPFILVKKPRPAPLHTLSELFPLNFCPLLILLLLNLMLVGIFPVYYILNCNLVCIRNSAHVNKAW